MARKRKKQSARTNDMTVGELISTALIKVDQNLTELNERDHVTKHDLQTAITDAKKEIISYVDRTVTPRLTRLEEKV